MNKVSFALILLTLLFTSCGKKTDKKLRIAAASNMQFALKEIVASFEKEHDIPCEVIISSSGKLTAQIMKGAPYDIFVSADMKYPTLLFNEGYCIEEAKIYAYGQLVLWVPNFPDLLSIDSLNSFRIKHIALANPKTAPYGKAAAEALRHFKLSDSLSQKFVFGESISQTNQFIISGAAEAGFTAKSVVLSTDLEENGNWIQVDAKAYQPIAQGIVILKNSNQLKNSLAFRDYLIGSNGEKILEEFGYEFNKFKN